MGIKNFWKMIKKHGKPVIPANKRLAVDTSIWIHQILKIYTVKKETTINVYSFFLKRIIKLLHYKIVPVFVFDGKNVSTLKLETIAKRKAKADLYEEKKIIEGIKLNRKCTRCDKSVRICEHGGQLREEHYSKLNEQTTMNIKNHDYSWGEHSDEVEYDDGFSLDYTKLNTNSKKMEKLNEFRLKRKLKMNIDTTNYQTLMSSQLMNIRKRAQVSNLIREINKNLKKVHGDSTIYSEFKSNRIENKFTVSNNINLPEMNSNLPSSPITSLNNKYSSIINLNNSNRIIESQNDKKVFTGPTSIFSKNNQDSRYLLQTKNVQSIYNDEEDQADYTNQRKDLFTNTRASETQQKLKRLLRILQIYYVDSPMESDSQCARLVIDNVVEGVISEDNDILLYGAKVYKNFFKKNHMIVEYERSTILKNLDLTFNQLIMLGMFLGSDYFEGVKDIGPVKAMEILHAKTEEEILSSYKEIDKIKYNEILKNYKTPVGKQLKIFHTKKIDKEELVEFLEEVDVLNIEEIIFHLESQNLLK